MVLGLICALVSYVSLASIMQMLMVGCLMVFAVTRLCFEKPGQIQTVVDSKIVFILLGFFIWAGLSLIWSEVPFYTLARLSELCVLPLILCVLWVRPFNEKEWSTFLKAWLGIGVCLSAFAIFQYFAFSAEIQYQARWPLNNPNSLALILNTVLLPYLWGLFKSDKLDAVKWFVLAILLLGLVATGSRAAILLSVVAALPLGVMAERSRRSVKRMLLVLAVFVSSFAFMSGYAEIYPDENQPSIAKDMTGLGGDQAAVNRLHIWRTSLAMMQDYPVFGTGAGTFYGMYPLYRGEQDQSSGSNAHSDILNVAVELGGTGVLFYVAFAALFLVTLIKKFRSLSHIQTVCALIVVVIALQGLLTTSLLLPSVLILLAIACTGVFSVQSDKKINDINSVLKYGICAIAVLFFAFNAMLFLQGQASRAVLEAREAGDPQMAAKYALQAKSLSFGTDPVALKTLYNFYEGLSLYGQDVEIRNQARDLSGEYKDALQKMSVDFENKENTR